MQKKKILAVVLAVTCAALLFGGCGSGESQKNTDNRSADNSSDHPVITMNAHYRNMSKFVDCLYAGYAENRTDAGYLFYHILCAWPL